MASEQRNGVNSAVGRERCAHRDCARHRELGDFCVYHSPEQDKPEHPFHEAIGEVERMNDLNWNGWVVPIEVNISGRAINGLQLVGVDFRKPVYFDELGVDSAVVVGRFRDTVSFSRAQIRQARFEGVTFDKTPIFALARCQDVTFKDCTFVEYAHFNDFSAGHATFENVTFRGGAAFRQVSVDDALLFVRCTFIRDVSFERTDLTRVSFLQGRADGLRLSAARHIAESEFAAVQWPGEGIPEEVEARKQMERPLLRSAERVYRELRRSAERRRAFREADWFDRREMEMRRLSSGWLSTEALYGFFGDYGHSILRPLLGLLLLSAIAPVALASAGIVLEGHTYSLAPWRDPALAVAEYARLFGFGLSLIALLPPPASASLSSGALVVAVALRIAAPLFALLLTLAVRRRVRR